MNTRDIFRRVLRKIILFSLVSLAFFLVWQLIATLGVFDASIVSSPSAMFAAMSRAWSQLRPDIAYTLKLIVGGFVLTVFLSFLAAVLLHLLPKISEPLFDFFVIVQSVPLFAIAPVLFYFTGRGQTKLDQMLTVILAAFFPVLVTTVEGLRRVDKDLIDVFDAMNASRLQKLFRLEIPSAAHLVLAGAKITLTMCVIGAVLAEMLVNEQVGLGARIKEANGQVNMAKVYACLMLLALLTVLLFAILTLIADLIQPWASSEEE